MIGVTGSTGGIGGRVAQRLAERGVAQRLIVRDAARAPQFPNAEIAVVSGYADREAMIVAMRGVDTLFLVSAREAPDRISDHVSAVDAAASAGVRRIVYTSFLRCSPRSTFTFARDHYATEQHIVATALDFTFLRDSLYLDYLPFMAGADGVIAGPAGEGRLAAVARDDVADAAIAVLTGTGHNGRTYDLTGPRAHTLGEYAAEIAAASGKSVTFRNQTLDEAYAARANFDAPKWEVDGWVSSYAAIGAGEFNVVSDDVTGLIGRPAMTLPEFLAAHPESCAHIR
jgi:uncharacterized protein YbjT (DUF2867 family)